MKKIFYIPILILTLFSITSCEDDSTNPLPERIEGQFIKLDVDRFHRQLVYTDLENTYFGGVLTNPGGKVVKYDITIRRTDNQGFITGNYVPFISVTSFPYELKVTPAMIAQALGLSVSDLKDGDLYRFYGHAYDANGNVATYQNLSALNRFTEEIEQGFRFNTNLTSTPDLINDTNPPYDNRQN